MPSKVICGTLPIVLALSCALIARSEQIAQEGTFSRELIQAGSKLFAQRCAICHGQNMRNPDTEVGAFDLRYFPRDEHDRFVRSVTGGKNAMPAWRDLINPAEIEALWAYVCAGER
jgi:mono/diheme cytochrome c family protein